MLYYLSLLDFISSPLGYGRSFAGVKTVAQAFGVGGDKQYVGFFFENFLVVSAFCRNFAQSNRKDKRK